MAAGFDRRSRKRGRSPGAGRSARACRGCRSSQWRWAFRRPAVELRPEENGCALEDLVGPPELAVLPLELDDAATLLGREAGPVAAIDLGLVNPLAQGLDSDAERAGHPGDGSGALAGLLDGLEDHPDGPLFQLSWITMRGVVAAGVVWHDSIFLQEVQR